MIRIIAKKEILEQVSSYRFAILSGMLLLIIGVSIFVSYGDFLARSENYTLNHPEPHSSNIMIRPTPFSLFAKGMDTFLGRMYYLKYSGIEVQGAEQSVDRLFSLFTQPDMLFIVRVLLSLIALLFTFDAITGEKEMGTLRLAAIAGGERMSLLAGKLTGRVLVVVIPFSFLFVAGALVVSLLAGIQVSADYWIRMAAFLAAADEYIVVFCAIGIFLSTMVHRSSSALALCLGVWVTFVFIVPESGMLLARVVSDVPPGERVEMQGRLATIRGIYEKIQREGDNGSPEGWRRLVAEARMANSQLIDSYAPKLERHVDITKDFERCSPAGCVTMVLTDLMGTGLFEERRFKNSVSSFFERNYDIISEVKNGELEEYRYPRAPVDEIFTSGALTDLFILACFGLLFIGGALYGFFRYDLR
ncbi:MAG TPA: ABC transporter permease subunit [Bacteroidota bacterium]|nr:ABC transporter permease subunit [Bacteroidota bacterium]